ncbi:MAG: SRPBCC family protein [Acidimicrobiales bacterium]
MTEENLTSTRRIDAPADAVFAVLADPATHADIDGTGWVKGPLEEGVRLTAEDQVFDMGMYHPQHPDGEYEIANRVVAFEPPTAIEWEPGYYVEDGQRDSGRWTWRYDLAEVGGQTDVTLTYDWSNATPEARERFQFPIFPVDKLRESLDNLAKLATS